MAKKKVPDNRRAAGELKAVKANLLTAANRLARAEGKSPCTAHCLAAYRACVAGCTTTSCVTRCFGRYILCVLNCRKTTK